MDVKLLLTANQCPCVDSRTFTVAGRIDPDDVSFKKNLLQVSLDPPSVNDCYTAEAILVFCSCERLTIHMPIMPLFPIRGHPSWKSRAMWTGWRKRTRILWDYSIPVENRTLRNIRSLTWNDSDGSVLTGLYAVNNPDYNFQIIPEVWKVTEKTLDELIRSLTRFGFTNSFPYRIRECSEITRAIAEQKGLRLSLLEQQLPGLAERIHTIKGSVKSPTIAGIETDLRALCENVGIALPNL